MTDDQGGSRTARTNSFGYFRFDDVAAGETYVVLVKHKRYRFSAQTVTVTDEITDLTFTAEE